MADDPITKVREARSGSPEAWDHLFRRYQLPLYAYVFELVRDEQESLDVVQETFINAVRYIDGLRADEKFASWLFGIAHQKCVQFWRAKSRRNLFQQPEEDSVGADVSIDEADPGECLLRKEKEQEFFALLERLEPPHRSVLLLHFIEEFSLEQIAEITGAQLGTVKSRMHYAKRALRKLLEDRIK